MKPFIYVHELIENSGGIWLGCDDENVVRLSHTEGETGEEVIALVKFSDAEARIEELEEVLKGLMNEAHTATKPLHSHSEWSIKAQKLLENK